ncbi:MAG: substrate-binding domain-containing protein [Opitutaceae bacterium]|nr:substrate-binding domain-containing protein [Opitutaceae bacterium]
MPRLHTALFGALLAAAGAGAQPHPSTGAAPQDVSHPALQFVRDLPAYTPAEQVEGVVRLWGHGSHRRNFMGNLIRRWTAEFARHQPGVVFENRMYGTASAIGALYSGAGEIALLGEEISPAAATAFMRAKGYAPTEIQISPGSVDVNFFDYAHMIFVHRDNPIAGLSLAQLEAIFGVEGRRGLGRIRTWGQLGLGGEWADQPIQPYGWKVDEDFALFFRERVLEHSHRWNPAIREHVHILRPDGTQYDHGQQILDALARDRFGIAISNVRYAVPEVRALPLAWRGGGPLVEDSRATLIDLSYPLVRIIPAYIDIPPGGQAAPAVREFLRYALSREGQQALIEETGYLPLGPEIIGRQLEKLGGTWQVERRGAGTLAHLPPLPPAPARDSDHSHSLPPVRTEAAKPGVIRVWCSPALAPLVESWQRAYVRAVPTARFEVIRAGSDVAMAGLYTGRTDIALLGREATAPELKAFEWVHRFKPARVEVATGGAAPGASPALAVFVHRDNPLAQLTLAELEAAFGAEEKTGARERIKTWDQLGLGGEWAGQPVRLYGPHMESGTGRFFREAVLGGSRKLDWDRLVEFADSGPLQPPTHDAGAQALGALSRDRFGLAVAGVEATHPGVRALALATRPSGPFVSSVPEAVASRAYPLGRPIYAYHHDDGKGVPDPIVADFLRWILDEAGQRAVATTRDFLPLASGKMTAAGRTTNP